MPISIQVFVHILRRAFRRVSEMGREKEKEKKRNTWQKLKQIRKTRHSQLNLKINFYGSETQFIFPAGNTRSLLFLDPRSANSPGAIPP